MRIGEDGAHGIAIVLELIVGADEQECRIANEHDHGDQGEDR